MKKHLFTAVLSLAFVFALGLSVNAQSVGIDGSIGAVKRGGSTRGTIVMNVPDGLHANSNRPGSEYAIPTIVKVSAPGGAKVGGVRYPRGRTRKFGFSEDALNVYEGRNTFAFNLTVPANYKGNTVRVRATVRYQTCTDEVCYPPKTQEITLTAKVR
ncbi:MAG TPA: protein-disulfide reductase DsbD N-terminal domain-containing protein [Pyrinomonadaceae bacterium]|nr:protein-disulfide reductase DsbD N-terminal domain-containing protein [Pyrinomonadaceae bacterium]